MFTQNDINKFKNADVGVKYYDITDDMEGVDIADILTDEGNIYTPDFVDKLENIKNDDILGKLKDVLFPLSRLETVQKAKDKYSKLKDKFVYDMRLHIREDKLHNKATNYSYILTQKPDEVADIDKAKIAILMLKRFIDDKFEFGEKEMESMTERCDKLIDTIMGNLEATKDEITKIQNKVVELENVIKGLTTNDEITKLKIDKIISILEQQTDGKQ